MLWIPLQSPPLPCPLPTGLSTAGPQFVVFCDICCAKFLELHIMCLSFSELKSFTTNLKITALLDALETEGISTMASTPEGTFPWRAFLFAKVCSDFISSLCLCSFVSFMQIPEKSVSMYSVQGKYSSTFKLCYRSCWNFKFYRIHSISLNTEILIVDFLIE